MERSGIHELTAAYALDALDPADEREYEEHLARCDRCREDLAELQQAAASLAYVPAAPAPPAALRSRILEQARRERANVVPLRPRRLALVGTGTMAVAAAAAAVVLAFWASSLSNSLDRERDRTALLTDPAARTIALTGVEGRLVVASNGRAALVLGGLDRAPAGKTYEVWVIEGQTPAPAGLFEAQRDREVVELTQRVPAGSTVAVTLELAGGVDAPTGKPVFAAKA